MAHYVVGDIQGCYKGLRGLLRKCKFKPGRDTLWAVGDLVARGDDSLSTLQFLYDLGDSFYTVLGNHDLHLLAIASGIRTAKASDKLAPLLKSKELPTFIDWLRQQPTARKIDKNTLLVHAGLYPNWSIKQCVKHSDWIAKQLRGKRYVELLSRMYGNTPTTWSKSHDDDEKCRFIINANTRMRFLDQQRALDFDLKVSPDNVPKDYAPWFAFENEKLKSKQRVIFGHWAALGGLTQHSQYVGLDTGYVWGGAMTAVRLEDMQFFTYNKQT